MTRLTQRVRRLESRSGTTAPRPWELAGWERLSEVDQLREIERYVAAYPDSPLARQLHAMTALSDVELEACIATLKAQEGAPS